MRRAVMQREVSSSSVKFTCASSESSESEGICADFCSKGAPSLVSSMVEEDDFWSDKLQPRLGLLHHLDQSFDLSHQQRRSFSVPQASPRLSSMCTSVDRTPKSTRIPRPMSHSFSANSNVQRLLPRRAFCSTEPMDGSREQLCEDFYDRPMDVKASIERSRMRTPHRSQTYDKRCLLDINTHHRSFSISPNRLQGSFSSKRLLNKRPQLTRLAQNDVIERPANDFSMIRSRIGSRSRDVTPLRPSEEATVTPTGSHKARFHRFRRNGLGGPLPLPMTRLVNWFTKTTTTCRICRHSRRLTHLSTSSISKHGVIYRSRCICRRFSPSLLPLTFPHSLLPRIYDLSILMSFIAILFHMILKYLLY